MRGSPKYSEFGGYREGGESAIGPCGMGPIPHCVLLLIWVCLRYFWSQALYGENKKQTYFGAFGIEVMQPTFTQGHSRMSGNSRQKASHCPGLAASLVTKAWYHLRSGSCCLL